MNSSVDKNTKDASGNNSISNNANDLNIELKREDTKEILADTANEVTNSKEFGLNTEKIERILISISIVLFTFSFFNANAKFWTVTFYSFCTISFIYYFGWFRKNRLYISIDGDDLKIQSPPFFRSHRLKIGKMEKPIIDENKIIIRRKGNNTKNKINIYRYLLKSDDWKSIVSYLKK